MSDDLQRQLINDLLIESFEGLDSFDRQLLSLENGTADKETLNVIFRVVHTIKGSAGCLGLARIEATTHAGESLLALLRDGKIQPGTELISALLSLSDALRGMLRHLELHGTDGEGDQSALIARLTELQTQQPAAPAAETDSAAFGLFDDSPPPPPPAAEPAPKPTATETPPAPAAKSVSSAVSDTAIRVDVGQLDRLMNLVGELVLARNQILQNVGHPDSAALAAASQRLNLITTELQGSVMKTRMQPIGNVWAKFPRIVRDLAKDLHKKVTLVMEGQETELDRTIIEAIKDPLTHIIRNAVDHGQELPAERVAAGKPEEGRLTLRAFHEGGQVNIEIIDDGRGIGVDRVRAKALERGLISPDQAARMGEREICNLVFLPGFSTAEKVTNLSGRGVGMDVVRTNIEKIGGSVDLQSTQGVGVTLKIKIPLTLAIIPALIVNSGGERFAIPQVNLLELVRLDGDEALRKIETLYSAPVYRLRGQLLPLVSLNEHLHLKSSGASDAVNIVVLQADGRQFGLLVDAIHDAEEIVVKPLGKQLKSLSCFAGATIMGDGRVALILDVVGLAQQARVVSETREHGVAAETHDTAARDERRTLLLFKSGPNRNLAIPLSDVARLEELPTATIEHSGGQEVVQYRGQIMPLIRVAHHVGASDVPDENPEVLQVVVHSENGRSVGLVVSNITDIVETPLAMQRTIARDGILGSAVIQQRVTDLIDLASIIRSAAPSFYDAGAN
ncbi:histidine kinase [Opitutaceae bacterium EW11]|nr:histidine kinase [Opitutaceae bacterium EW11]